MLFSLMPMVMVIMTSFPMSMVMVTMLFSLMPMVMVIMTSFLMPMVMVMTAVTVTMVIMRMMMALCLFPQEFLLQGHRMFHSIQQFLSAQLPDRRGDQGCIFLHFLRQELHGLLDLLRLGHIRPAQDDRLGVFHLIDEKFPEIAQIHFTSVGIHHGGAAV